MTTMQRVANNFFFLLSLSAILQMLKKRIAIVIESYLRLDPAEQLNSILANIYQSQQV